MSDITLRGLSKRYRTPALDALDLSVPAGDRLALLGPSGCGKTTLLRLIAGLEAPDAGSVHIGGVDVTRLPPHRRGVGFVPQRVALYPQLSVRENLVESARRFVPTNELPGRVAEAAELLRITPLLERRPHELSGGERQRVGLARLAARRPAVWLLDEPFAPLDPMFRGEFRHDLHLLLTATGATIVLVTHDPIDALALGRRVGVLGDGRLQQLGTPETLRLRPSNRFVAVALGRLSLIDGRRSGGESATASFVADDGSVTVPLPERIAAARTPTYNLTLGIRPEDVRPCSDPECGTLRGWEVTSAEPVGSGWQVAVARGRTRVVGTWLAESPPPVGAPTDWTIPADRCDWFDGTGQRID